VGTASIAIPARTGHRARIPHARLRRDHTAVAAADLKTGSPPAISRIPRVSRGDGNKVEKPAAWARQLHPVAYTRLREKGPVPPSPRMLRVIRNAGIYRLRRLRRGAVSTRIVNTTRESLAQLHRPIDAPRSRSLDRSHDDLGLEVPAVARLPSRRSRQIFEDCPARPGLRYLHHSGRSS